MIMGRLDRLRRLFYSLNIFGAVITDMKNVRYLSGFTGSEGTLIITENSGLFLTDGRYTTQASREVKAFETKEYKKKTEGIADAVKELGIGRVGVESHHMTLSIFDDLKDLMSGIELIPMKKDLSELRMIKEDDEIASIKRAVKIAEDSLNEIIPMISPGVSEKEIATELEHAMKLRGSGPLPFPIIVASGEHGSLVHARPGSREIKSGELLLIDFGAENQGYASDETVTFMIGKESAREREIYDIVRGAQREGINKAKPGVPVKEVDNAVRDFISKSGFADFFSHGTGHGVGLDVHEPPHISPLGNGLLSPGMVITIEPGIYIPGWGGIRIEDMVLVTKKEPEILTTFSKSFRVLP
jgi:Xaa-Pro aminopeptidase